MIHIQIVRVPGQSDMALSVMDLLITDLLHVTLQCLYHIINSLQNCSNGMKIRPYFTSPLYVAECLMLNLISNKYIFFLIMKEGKASGKINDSRNQDLDQ